MPNPKGLDYVPSFPYHMNADGIMDLLTEPEGKHIFPLSDYDSW